MDNPSQQVQCPNCLMIITVEPEWRLVQCPRCKGMVSRMSEDSSYD